MKLRPTKLKGKTVVGWREYVDLPEWGIEKLKAKIDTGARTSSLHVEDIKELWGNRIRFFIILHRSHRDQRVKVIAKVLKRGKVKSITGLHTVRWYVETKMRLGPIERTIPLNLVDRGEMIHRILLGRTALDENTFINPHRSFLLNK